jgi:hypothetical protein
MAQTKRKKSSANKTVTITSYLKDQKIHLKVSCSKDGWELLRREYFHQAPKPFDYDFYFHFVRPAIEKIRKPKSIHGNHSFVLMMKAQAAALYLFFKPYFAYRKVMEKYPGYRFNGFDFDPDAVRDFMKSHQVPFSYVWFNQFESVIERNIRWSLNGRIPKTKHTATLYVAHCMQTVYQDLLDEKGIKYFLEPLVPLERSRVLLDDLNNFYKTYVSQGIKLWKEHLKIVVTELKWHRKYNRMEYRLHSDTQTTFEKSLSQLYAFHYSKIDPGTCKDAKIFHFVGHLLRAMRFIFSDGSTEPLTPESGDMCKFLLDMFRDGYDLLPYRYVLSRDEQFILTRAYSKL